MKNIFVKISLILMLITMSVGQVWADGEYGASGSYIYLDLSASTQWFNGYESCVTTAMFYGTNDTEIGKYKMTRIGDSRVYYTKTDNNYVRAVQAVRGKDDCSATYWDYSNKVACESPKNCFYMKAENANWWNSWDPAWKTYVPPMSTLNIKDNGTTMSSGSGTLGDPYIIAGGATVKVAAKATMVVDDTKPTFKYKYSTNGGTSYGEYGSGNNTYQFTADAAGAADKVYAVTVRAYATYNSTDNTAMDATNTVYFKVLAAAPVVTDYYLANNGWCGGNWVLNEATKMVDNGDGSYSKTILNVTAEQHEFQIATTDWGSKFWNYDSSCSSNQGTVNSNVDAGYGAKKIQFTLATAGDVTITFYPNDGNKICIIGPTPAATYTVTYAAGEGSGSMTDSNSPYEAGTEVTLLDNTFTAPTGKVFDGWQVKDASNNDVTVTAGKFTMPASNVTVTAQWVTSCTPSSYELWASSGKIAEFTPTSNANEYELTFKLTDAIMNNLYVKDNCGNTYGYSGAINPGGSITLVKGFTSFRFESAAQNETWHYVFNSSTLLLSSDAQSEEKKNVTVTYNANGGYFDEHLKRCIETYRERRDAMEKYGTAYSKSVTPIRAGYNFLGWFTTQDGGIEITTVTTATAHSVYAHWEQIYLYVVGRFNIYDEEHDTWIKTKSTDSGWDLNSKNIQFTFNETTKKYELQTNAKPYDLSVNMDGYPQYFMVREGSASAANGVRRYTPSASDVSKPLDSSTLITPFLPTLSIASETILPISSEPDDIAATLAISALESIFLALSNNLSATALDAKSIPSLSNTGLAPFSTASKPE